VSADSGLYAKDGGTKPLNSELRRASKNTLRNGPVGAGQRNETQSYKETKGKGREEDVIRIF